MLKKVKEVIEEGTEQEVRELLKSIVSIMRPKEDKFVIDKGQFEIEVFRNEDLNSSTEILNPDGKVRVWVNDRIKKNKI